MLTFYNLGLYAPPYLVIAIGITMAVFFTNNMKQYKEIGVDIYKVPFFKKIPLCVFIYSFAIGLAILLVASIINIFLPLCDTRDFIHLTLKMSLGFCTLCVLYSFREYLRKSEEDFLDKE